MGSASEAAESNNKSSKQLQSPLLTSLQPTSAGSGSDDGHGHGAGKQLESILNDESVPWGRRMCAATVVEMRMLVRLAAPAVLVYMINYVMSMSTQIFSGHLGTLELAAASFGNYLIINNSQIRERSFFSRRCPRVLIKSVSD